MSDQERRKEMAFVPMKCPSCGADISLDDSKEYGFCQFCGTRIMNTAIQRLKVEYSGDPMSVTHVNNTVNNQNITNVTVDNRPGMVVEKPKMGLAVGGTLLIILGILFLVIALQQKNSSGYVLTAILLIGGALCFLVFIRQWRYYDAAMKNAINQNNVTNRR